MMRAWCVCPLLSSVSNRLTPLISMLPYKLPRSLSRRLSKVEVGGHVNEEAGLSLASAGAIGSQTARRDAAPQPDFIRYQVGDIACPCLTYHPFMVVSSSPSGCPTSGTLTPCPGLEEDRDGTRHRPKEKLCRNCRISINA